MLRTPIEMASHLNSLERKQNADLDSCRRSGRTRRPPAHCFRRAAIDAETGILVFLLGLEILLPEGFGSLIIDFLSEIFKLICFSSRLWIRNRAFSVGKTLSAEFRSPNMGQRMGDCHQATDC